MELATHPFLFHVLLLMLTQATKHSKSKSGKSGHFFSKSAKGSKSAKHAKTYRLFGGETSGLRLFGANADVNYAETKREQSEAKTSGSHCAVQAWSTFVAVVVCIGSILF